MNTDREKPKGIPGGPVSRREFLLMLAGGTVGAGLVQAVNQLSGASKNALATPTFEPFIVVSDLNGEGFEIVRTGEKEVRIIDRRPPGNVLHPDRQPQLREIAQHLQTNYKCDFTKFREDNHDLLATVTDPKCILDMRDKLREEQKSKEQR